MWILIISNITWSILGSATDSWFAETKCGIWFYKKINQIFTWSAKKLNIKMLANEEAWKNKYPNIAIKLTKLDDRIKKLEQGE
jgi:hypothetical protein